MKTVCVIQARMGSTRLPGKVLMDLGGRPVLAHVVDRAKHARTVDQVVVATSRRGDDDLVAALASALGVATVRGPEDDVLTRYCVAAEEHRADIVVRITADCPLVDARLIDRVVWRLRVDQADYASNVMPPTYPDGYDVEALTRSCLNRLDVQATNVRHREHVTLRLREGPDGFRIARVMSRRDLSALRLTLDRPDDLRLLRSVYSRLQDPDRAGLGAVLTALRDLDATGSGVGSAAEGVGSAAEPESGWWPGSSRQPRQGSR